MSKRIAALVDVMYREQHVYYVDDDFEASAVTVQDLVNTHHPDETDTREVLDRLLLSYDE